MTDKSFIPNSYQTPNAYCDQFMYLLTPPEWKVLSYAVRRIFGFQKRQDHISLSQFVHGTVSTIDGEHLDHGTGLSKGTVMTCLETLIRFRLIVRLANNDPLKNEGDLYALQLDYDQVDYAGLIERANERAGAELSRTAQMRNLAEQRRLTVAMDLPGQSDRPRVVSGTDRGWSVGLTGGGQSDRPGVVSGTDPQYTDGNPVRNQEGVSHPDFDRACAALKESNPLDFDLAAPILLEYNQKPNRMRIKLDSVPAGFMDQFRSELAAVSRRAYVVSFETPGTGQVVSHTMRVERKPEPAAPDQPETTPDQDMLWESIVSELSVALNRQTFLNHVKPTKLVSVNGTWKVAVPSTEWWQRDAVAKSLARIVRRLSDDPVQFEFVEVA